MQLSELCIQRPVFATVLSLVVLLLGVVGYQALNVREYPNIDEPAVSVVTTYPGAGAEIMETQVTMPLEDSLAGIDGIKSITSSSREGVSSINLRFVLARDPDSAAADVRDRVSRARGRLPETVDEPVVAKVEADSSPIIFLVLSSEALSGGALTDLADRVVREQIQSIPGVAEVNLFGARVYAMRIWLDPLRLNAFNLTAPEIADALAAQNLDVPSGRLIGAGREFAVQTRTDLNTPEDFRNLVVRTTSTTQLRLGDVARVELGISDDTTTFRFNNQPTVALGIIRQAVANPLEIATTLRAMLPQIQANLPAGVSIAISNDTTVFIAESLKNVYITLAEALVLVGLVILLFLRSWRAAIIPLVAIPISLFGAFFIMYLLGFSLNTLTLLALVLAIGLVVDDAIVMLENIYRHIEAGIAPLQAALRGAREVGFAVVAMTITLAAVFVPVVFMGGRTGKLFTEFALTLTAAVLVSGFVALTLSPMLGAYLLKAPEKKPSAQGWQGYLQRGSTWLEGALQKMEDGYTRLLARLLHNWRWVWLVLPVLALVVVGIFMVLKAELSPVEDRARVFVSLTGPEGATSDAMAIYATQLAAAVQRIPEIQAAGFITGVGSGRLPQSNQGFGFLALAPWGERERPSSAVAAQVRGLFTQVPGITAVPILPQSLGAGGRSQPIELVIQDSRPYSEIFQDLEQVLERLNSAPELSGVEHSLRLNTPQAVIRLERQRMADLGVTAADAGRTIELLLAGRTTGRFKAAGEQYDVLLQMEESLRLSPGQLSSVFVRASSGPSNGQLVPLAAFAVIDETVTPRELSRYGRARSVTLTSGLAPGVALTDGLAVAEAAIREVFPPQSRVAYAGQTLEFKESGSALWLTFALALIFIYLVLAAQFESFRDPLIILITVPLTMLGAVLALKLTGNTLNIYSQIGLITLIGLTAKNGILLVEFANAELAQQAKMTVPQAMLAAARLRLRPILMTTAATILGAIPLALATGAGAESRHQLGWVIVGGVSVGTLLTLLVLPAVYCWLRPQREAHRAL